LVIDREHMYELNGEDSCVLSVVGAFRVVPERELGSERDDAPDRDKLWVQASLDQKQRLQQLFFPDRVAFDGNRFNRTAETAPFFKYLAPPECAKDRHSVLVSLATRGAAAFYEPRGYTSKARYYKKYFATLSSQ
jgi:hypothetical protein